MATVPSIKLAEDLHGEWVKRHVGAAREAIADSVMFECPVLIGKGNIVLRDALMARINDVLREDELVAWGANLKADIPDFQRFVDEWEPDSFEADNEADNEGDL